MPTLIDLTGQTLGRLTVLERVTGRRQAMWRCRCACGSERIVRSDNLRSGSTTSCGCLHAEVVSREVVTYSGAHQRVRRLRGKAADYPCADCGGRADQWSYDGLDLNEQIEQRKRIDGEMVPMAYSLETKHYHPRCDSCHRSLDRHRRGE